MGRRVSPAQDAATIPARVGVAQPRLARAPARKSGDAATTVLTAAAQ